MWPALIAAGASLAGGAVGAGAAADGRRQAERIWNNVTKRYELLDVPDLLERESQQYLQPGASENVNADPEAVGLQRQALMQMMQRSRMGGFNPEDQARMNDAVMQSRGEEQAQRQAVMSNAQQRGVAGSGMEMAQQMMAQQGAANRASTQGANIAASANRAALEALKASGGMASQYRQQGVKEAQDRARAHDDISRFNVANAQSTNQRNTDRALSAQKDRFGMEVGKTQGIANAGVGQANNSIQSGNQTAAMWANGGAAAGDLVLELAKRKKEE